MAGERQDYRLGEIGRVVTGRTPPGSAPKFFGADVPFLTPTDMDGRRRVGKTARSLSSDGVRHLSKVVIPYGVAVSCIGWQMGKSVLVDRPVITNQQINSVIPNRDIADDTFLYYLLASMKDRIFGLGAGGSRTPILNKSGFESLTISVPPLLEQRAIAHILGTLDDKIELNRRRNQTLEAMARALFKDWFVDFGPVRAKMAGQEPYLPADLWQLFPERLNDEGKPEGWEIADLREVTTELRRGISPSYLESGGVRVLNQKCIRNREFGFGSARRHDYSKRKVEGREVMAGDILVNSTGVGTLGRTAQIWTIDEPTVVDSHVTVVRPNADIVSDCYLGLNLTGREAEIEALGEGSTGQTELSRVRLGCLPVLVPTRGVLNQFDKNARPLLDAMLWNIEENTNLAKIRDALLPKLISGELRITNAEKFIGRVECTAAGQTGSVSCH